MNFLGHFYLSKNDSDLIVGNFIADFVKGNKFMDYPKKISDGILMHREIDHYTDRHQMVRRGRKRLFGTFRHYSGVIIDMYYDHYLARLWNNYSKEPLDFFADNIYKTIETHWGLLPEKSRYMFPYMKHGNWLVRYASTEGIDLSLNGMSRRLNNNSGLEQATHHLRRYYDDFEEEFKIFISEIKERFA
ncbi:MAG: ACP phosphodiesterase [Cytophagales bacterium]|nr:ACP phosphodiesterase [Cytophagales bacterium]